MVIPHPAWQHVYIGTLWSSLQLKAMHWYWVFTEGPGTFQHLPEPQASPTTLCSELLCNLLDSLQRLLRLQLLQAEQRQAQLVLLRRQR